MKLSTNRLISIWFGLIMILVLVAGSIALILFPAALSDRLYGNKRVFFIVLLLGYSVYRGFRIYFLYKQMSREE